MNKQNHLTADDLVLFMDRELDAAATASAELHLLHCVECSNALKALKDGAYAYDHYHEAVLKPDVAAPVYGWAPIGGRQPRRTFARWWWAAAACAATLVGGWLYLPFQQQPNAQDVIEKAAALPEAASARGQLLLTSGNHRFVRPAVWEAGASEARFQHFEALFVRANYSWKRPLSARSFASWRRQLLDKRDFVTTIREEGNRPYYRVRTRTDSGVLRSASLTLEADSYAPTRASFEFQGEDLIEISQQNDLPPSKPLESAPLVPPPHPKVIETAAGPEDELRVFEILDAIGADAEEPIDVKLDSGHHAVLVTGLGIPPNRQKEIEKALAALPNTIVRFGAGQPGQNGSGPTFDPGIPSEKPTPQFRQRLQDLAGGVRPLQTIVDESLETSNSLFAQSHSLLMLAHEFPPAVEAALSQSDANLLLTLRQRHIGAMSYALRRLRDQLKPLLVKTVPAGASARDLSWQNMAGNLFEATRNLDRLVSRLLSGSFDESAGEAMLDQLPAQIAQVESLVRADSR